MSVMNHPSQYNIALIGCGKMGASMIHGWVMADLIKHAEILDPNDIDDSLSSHPQTFHVKLMESLFKAETDIVILAVKPQIMDEICQQLKPILPPNIPVLSIAAGKTTDYFQKSLGIDTPIIRAMPNTPAAIGKGITALYATPEVHDAGKHIASRLFEAIGSTIWLEDENLMNTVTALSGSGPAYVFYMMEAMTKAGETLGLSKDHAMTLARQTIIGSAALAEQSPETPASILRQNVTSKGGTTEAALNKLMDGRFEDLITEALTAAHKRGQELAD